jgi:hypothetical protein
MGYRLAIYDKPNIWNNEKSKYNDDAKLLYYGTKLYGYIGDEFEVPERKLKSYQYLVEIGVINDEEIIYFGYGFTEQNYKLTKEQFKKFVELYMQDLEEWETITNKELFRKEITPIVELDCDKYISWE